MLKNPLAAATVAAGKKTKRGGRGKHKLLSAPLVTQAEKIIGATIRIV